MARNELYQFYVEGEGEKKIIETLKKDMSLIVSGKVEVLNVVQHEIKNARLMTLKKGTNVVLVYDTDVCNTDILDKNIKLLKSNNRIKRIMCIPQVLNLEDELIRATTMRKVTDLLNSKTLTDYKRDLLKCSNLDRKLYDKEFDISKFWNEEPPAKFSRFGNDSALIKK